MKIFSRSTNSQNTGSSGSPETYEELLHNLEKAQSLEKKIQRTQTEIVQHQANAIQHQANATNLTTQIEQLDGKGLNSKSSAERAKAAREARRLLAS